MEISSHPAGHDIVVIALREANLDASNVREFKETMQALVGPTATRVVFDLQGVKFIDSSGLEALLDATENAEQAGGGVRIVNAPEITHDILIATRLSTRIELHNDVPLARKSFL